ncbi:MAG: hypothetical protein QM813_16940 [Verrucomicrobiota bacterium]
MIYEYRCPVCTKLKDAVRTVANRNRAPRCCDKAMIRQISSSYHISPMFTGYRAIGGDRRYIATRSEHNDFLREFNYAEVGNDASYAPPPDDPEADAAKQREVTESLEQLKHAPEETVNV